jgi:hypothetical protein
MRQHITRRVAILLATVALALTVPLAVFASHQFTDVPNSNLYHADIDALVDSGVTTGCGGGRYCPKAYVTREQMAAFMNRLGALAPGKTPVVNATTVDRYDANDLIRVAGDSGPANLVAITATFSTFQNAADIVINAPSAGFVLVNGAISVQNAAATCAGFVCGNFVRLQNTTTGTIAPYVVVDAHGTTNPNGTASVSFAFPVSAGNNTFQLQIARASAGQSPSYFSPQITGLFTPFGSSGGATLGVADTLAAQGPLGGQ